MPLDATMLFTEFTRFAALSPGAKSGSMHRVYERTLRSARRRRIGPGDEAFADVALETLRLDADHAREGGRECIEQGLRFGRRLIESGTVPLPGGKIRLHGAIGLCTGS